MIDGDVSEPGGGDRVHGAAHLLQGGARLQGVGVKIRFIRRSECSIYPAVLD